MKTTSNKLFLLKQVYNLYLFIYCHPLVHVWVICFSFTYDLDVSVFAVRRVSQLYVNIFMPALPVSSVCTKANTHNIFPLLFLFVCILKFDSLPFTVPSAGCFHVPAAGTLSTEPGTVHILQKHDDSRRAAVKVQTESMFGFFWNLQGIIWPQVIAGFFGNVLNAVSNCFLLYVLDMGVV